MPSEITSDLSLSSYAWLSPAATVPGRSAPAASRRSFADRARRSELPAPAVCLLAVGDFTGRQRVGSHAKATSDRSKARASRWSRQGDALPLGVVPHVASHR
jgi:hypothetical protein